MIARTLLLPKVRPTWWCSAQHSQKEHSPSENQTHAGIALASNLGGMTSPISSPQNIFAIEQMSTGEGAPSWLTWFAVSLPVSVVAAIMVWGLLIFVYPPNVKAVQRLPELKVSSLPGFHHICLPFPFLWIRDS